jgi:hypothetical protein
LEEVVEKKKLSPAPEPSKIEVGLGFKSTRNFSSVSFNISITDFQRAEETLDEATERVYAYVEHKTVEKLDAALRELEHVYD